MGQRIFLSVGLKEVAITVSMNQLDVETLPPDNDRKLRSLVFSPRSQSAPFRAVQSGRGRVVLRVGVPFAQISYRAT